MTQKVLVAYGDDEGPRIIGAAEEILKATAPDLEILHGRIGADAYRNTSYALPPETLDMLSECCAAISGPVDMSGIGERNPLDVVKMQMGLLAEYREIFPLDASPDKTNMDVGIISPTFSDLLDIQETEDLDGTTSSFYTNADAIADLFGIARRLSGIRNAKKIWFSEDNRYFPTRNRIIKKTFQDAFDTASYVSVVRDPSEISYHLAYDPESIDIILCGTEFASQICGFGAGIIGNGGLMPHAFLSKNFGLFLSTPPLSCETRERVKNPTSAILSVAVMLRALGRKGDYDLIRNAVCEMYRTGRTTRDVGGKLTPAQFTEGIRNIIYTEKLAD